MMDTIVSSFHKQLDALFRDEAMDIASDITVMESLLAQEGLNNEGPMVEEEAPQPEPSTPEPEEDTSPTEEHDPDPEKPDPEPEPESEERDTTER